MFFFINKRLMNIQRNYHTNSTSINVLTNKEINRKKKQQTWMKKINAKEIPRKKFGNKLGTVAKQLYLLADLKGNPINDNICNPNGEKDIKTKLDNYYFQNGLRDNNQSYVNNISKIENKNDVEILEGLSNYKKSKLQWDEICDELKYHLPFLQPYSISMALNYLSKINYNEYDIFKLVAEQIDERWLKNFNIKDLCQLLLSYSRLNSKFYVFINLISKELLYKICYSDFEDLSLIAYAYTKLGMYDYEVFLHICNEAKHKIKDEQLKNGQPKGDDTINDCDINCGTEKVPNVSNHTSDTDVSRIDVGDNKKYSHLSLLAYCLGKNKHNDSMLLNLIVEYIDLKIVNNIDLSNLAYGFSVLNIYNNCLYESLCKKIYQDINKIESLQKIIIMGYLLKYPQYKMLDLYYIYLKNINEEIKKAKKKIYKEVVFLNMCINSFSCDKFLSILFDSVNIEPCENDKINKLFFLYNFLITYVDYFMKNKNVDSRDYPKILTILFKILYFGDTKSGNSIDLKDVNISESNKDQLIFFENYKKQVDIHKAALLLDLALDNIIKQVGKLHKYDLNNIKSLLNICIEKKDINCEFNFMQKAKAILSC
ncbi:conserved Plasmodium protein, unknown function [Plasmodium vinckei vinckei]|uniref:Uncharacterized protein n=1 Tax=Plasmodium vinckei vinckei TaxID=54757 RepID=A0A449BT68_PLAVN|nr:conserved Plasmodium protein, unknown function [Plasmodium vinckei vinckei]KEG02349.1 hypothetical protein YYE_03088 [Plasmodium vinckei vinckei]VEV56593.1 conserved Plasmodium protein, unknown function [Plasmodium vinckei vinckei]